MIIYLVLSKSSFKYSEKKDIMNKLNLLSIQRCETWIESMREDSLLCITNELRGSYKRNIFYDLYPDLEQEAKAYALNNMSKKQSNFTVKELANFVNERYNELYKTSNNSQTDANDLIRSEESIRCDLMRWGAKYDANKKRPYFEGHEREDVIKSRKEFCSHFIENKHLYYQTVKKDNIYSWVFLIDNKLLSFIMRFYNILFQVRPSLNLEIRIRPRILIAHDESTYRSGEIPLKRWIYEDLAPFHNKVRGRSIMVSAFIVLNDSIDIFELDQNEWNEALK